MRFIYNYSNRYDANLKFLLNFESLPTSKNLSQKSA